MSPPTYQATLQMRVGAEQTQACAASVLMALDVCSCSLELLCQLSR